MKDDLAFKQSKRLRHTRQHTWDPFAEIAQMGVKNAGGAAKVFGTKPNVADYVPTDLGKETAGAVRANIKNYPEIAKLLNTILPGYSEMLASGTKSAKELLRGEIPSDVANAVRRSSAFQSLMGGFAGSALGKALGARDLGRTSLDMQERGANSAQRWAALATGLAAPYTVTGPAAVEASFQNKMRNQITQQKKFDVIAAPDPRNAGTFNLQAAMGTTALSMGFGALSGMASGGNAPAAPPSGYPAPGGGAGGVYNNDPGWRANAMSYTGYQPPPTTPITNVNVAGGGGGGAQSPPWAARWQGWGG